MAIIKLTNQNANIITAGTFGDGRISASSVNQHATDFDDNKIVNDLSTLGLRVHTQENLNASNTNSASFDVFQDSSGITNLTNALRDTDGEYMTSSSVSYTSPSTTADDVVVLDSFGHSNGETNIQDISTGGVGQTTIQVDGSMAYSSNQSLTGPSVSIRTTGGSSDAVYNANANTPSSTAFSNLPSQTNYTIETYFYPLSTVNYGSNNDSLMDFGTILQFEYDGSQNLYVYNAFAGGGSGANANLGTFTKDQWHHIAYVKQGTTAYIYKNGVQSATGTAYSSNFSDNYFRYGYHRSSGARNFEGYLDLLRISNRAIYQNGTTFTPDNEWNYLSSTLNASGSFEGATITAGSSISSMGAVITYQDTSGTNTLNTDIILKLSADNGSNYSTATLTALPDFATGIKMAKVNDLSVTAGTQLKYKIEFANQSSGSKEARIRGVSLQY
jgi:hypothetical protein|tara:strand:- start:550 stop:1881 length:1332 start_codon:yes stop_codon:yes gene_type:complete